MEELPDELGQRWRSFVLEKDMPVVMDVKHLKLPEFVTDFKSSVFVDKVHAFQVDCG